MNTAICVALFAFGHLVRDGWPPFKETLMGLHAPAWIVSLSTQLARVTGALLCGLGVFFVALGWYPAVLIGAAILAGFYTDTKHGEGQQAGKGDNRWWSDVAYLSLSGVTSMIPLAALAWVYADWTCTFAMLSVGLAKPPIWFVAWRVVPVRPGRWLSPTRAAAMAFGAVIGGVVLW